MSSTDIGIAARRESSAESLPELVAGLAVVVLTILGLAGVSPAFLVEIATMYAYDEDRLIDACARARRVL